MQVTYPASLPETPRFPSPPPMAPFSSATATGKGYQHRWVADFGRSLLNFETRRNGPMATVALKLLGSLLLGNHHESLNVCICTLCREVQGPQQLFTRTPFWFHVPEEVRDMPNEKIGGGP